MPDWRKPVSASTIAFMPCHSLRLSMISGISRGSRAILRHQPQLRLDCSPAMWPFSQSTVGMPFLARKSAVLAPMMPPPTLTTPALGGRALSEGTGSTRGAIVLRPQGNGTGSETHPEPDGRQECDGFG